MTSSTESWREDVTPLDVLVAGREADAVPDRRRRVRRLVATAAAFVVLAALALGPFHNVWSPGPQRDVTRVVRTYTAGWNDHAATAIISTMTPEGTFAAGETLENPLIGPMSGGDLRDFLLRVFTADVHLETTGDVVVLGDNPYRVSVPQRIRYHTYGLDVAEDGFSLFTVLDVDGQMKIVEHFWWRPYHGREPSMLWAADAASSR